jgi:hypothetical protein
MRKCSVRDLERAPLPVLPLDDLAHTSRIELRCAVSHKKPARRTQLLIWFIGYRGCPSPGADRTLKTVQVKQFIKDSSELPPSTEKHKSQLRNAASGHRGPFLGSPKHCIKCRVTNYRQAQRISAMFDIIVQIAVGYRDTCIMTRDVDQESRNCIDMDTKVRHVRIGAHQNIVPTCYYCPCPPGKFFNNSDDINNTKCGICG